MIYEVNTSEDSEEFIMPEMNERIRPKEKIDGFKEATQHTTTFDLGKQVGYMFGKGYDEEDITMTPDKVLNFCLLKSNYMDDSIDGEKKVESIGFFDFMLDPEAKLASNTSESVSL